jgi:hypothetical protein
MSLNAYQIIAPTISLIAVIYAWSLVFRQRKTIWEASLWTLFWGAIAFIALYPDAITYISAFTGIKDRENAVLVTFLGILFFIVFYIVIRLEELEQRQTRIVRKVALKRAGLYKAEEETEEKE